MTTPALWPEWEMTRSFSASWLAICRAFQAAAKTEDLARARRIEDLPAHVEVLEKALGELMAALAPYLPDEHSS